MSTNEPEPVTNIDDDPDALQVVDMVARAWGKVLNEVRVKGSDSGPDDPA